MSKKQKNKGGNDLIEKLVSISFILFVLGFFLKEYPLYWVFTVFFTGLSLYILLSPRAILKRKVRRWHSQIESAGLTDYVYRFINKFGKERNRKNYWEHRNYGFDKHCLIDFKDYLIEKGIKIPSKNLDDICMLLRFFIDEKERQRIRELEGEKIQEEERKKWPYKKKNYLFTVAESRFYKSLRNFLSDEYSIFSKVRLADILFTPGKKDHYNPNWNKIRSKHVDFLVCDNDKYCPLAAIELDDSSHDSEDRIERDKFLDEIFEDAGLKLIRFKVAQYYDTEEFKAKLFDDTTNNK